jgi:hypothetical protein
LERGSFRGRFVSAPMMRCEAERWLRAERTCGALKAGFNGTCNCVVSFRWFQEGNGKVYQYCSQLEQRIRDLNVSLALLLTAVTRVAYSRELDIIPQRHSNSIALLHTEVLQSPGQLIRVAIKRIICENRSLVMRNHTAQSSTTSIP